MKITFTLLSFLLSFQLIWAQEKIIVDTLNVNTIIFYTQNEEDVSSRIYGTMDYVGNIQIKPEYQFLSRVNNEMMVACKGNWNLYKGNKEAKILLKHYGFKTNAKIVIFYDLKGNYGVINNSNEVIIPFEYSYINGCCNDWEGGKGKNSIEASASKVNDGCIYHYYDTDEGGSGSHAGSNWAQNKGKLEIELKL